jgi:hypothetical protein
MHTTFFSASSRITSRIATNSRFHVNSGRVSVCGGRSTLTTRAHVTKSMNEMHIAAKNTRRNKNTKTHNMLNYFNRKKLVRFEVFTTVTMKNALSWDVAPFRSCVNRRFGGMYRLRLQSKKIRRLEPRAHAGSSLEDFSTVMMESKISSET